MTRTRRLLQDAAAILNQMQYQGARDWMQRYAKLKGGAPVSIDVIEVQTLAALRQLGYTVQEAQIQRHTSLGHTIAAALRQVASLESIHA